ncbi:MULTISPECIES: hypothetical protein [Stenotrophomonas]|uniref:hypothetical protein n=1 Tax=Stenotrophomonas TaxID=40323 RepID=UPI000872EF56|nr:MULTISPECIES: hypothetical protein [Stenotrophomonas]OEZ02276.1 hypothetical protein BIY45_01745 [Stenotrophomonas sp. BIIR7]
MTVVACARRQREYSRRAGLARARLFAHVVEGKLLTSRQIADVIGTTVGTASTRAKRGPFPLTWASLQSARAPQQSKEQTA